MMPPVFRAVLFIPLLLAHAVSHAGKPVANAPPTVSLTFPTSGANFVPPANITLTATAADSDGTVARVDFYQGTSLIGAATTSPYTIVWNNVSAGSYTLSAKATDNKGTAASSSPVSITVSAPSVTITSPAQGETIYGSATVTGTFVGPSNSTILVDNGSSTVVASINGSGYSAVVPLLPGANTLTVRVARPDRTSTSSSVTVSRNSAPIVVFKAPGACPIDGPTDVLLAVDAVSPGGSITRVDFYRDSTLLATVNSPPYQYVWVGAPAGMHTLHAYATDSAGYRAGTTASVQVVGPNVPPTVSLTSPANGTAFTAPANIPLVASASDPDGSVTNVDFFHGTNILAATNVAPYAYTWSNVPAGSYSFTARATDDRSGTTTSSPVSVSVLAPNNPPAVAVTSPASGTSSLAPASIMFSADASDTDGSIVKVDFYANNTLVGTAAGAPYTVSWNSVPAGDYSLTARATDNLGASTTSAPVGITVSLPPPNNSPTVNLTSPAAGASFSAPATIPLAASAADNDGGIARVDFFQATTLIGTATSAPYTFNWTNVAAGSYTVTAQATDNLGATTISPPVSITVNALSVALGEPANGATFTGNRVLVAGSFQAPPNSGITVNGVVAALDANHNFYAHLPLAAGANTITATLTTPTGQSATQSITVNGDGVAPAIQISPDRLEGIAPLTVIFSVKNNGATDAGVQFNGGTALSVPAGGTGTFTATYPEPWAYPSAFTITDSEGNPTTQSFVVVAYDAAQMDQMFKSLWGGMANALAAGDKATALNYLSAPAQAKYGPVFNALQPDLAQIFASFSALQSSNISSEIGEYVINRTIDGASQVFFIYFLKGVDGVWRLDSM